MLATANPINIALARLSTQGPPVARSKKSANTGAAESASVSTRHSRSAKARAMSARDVAPEACSAPPRKPWSANTCDGPSNCGEPTATAKATAVAANRPPTKAPCKVLIYRSCAR